MINCPKCHNVMGIKRNNRIIVVNLIEVDVIEDTFVCPICGLSVGTVQTAGQVQRDIINTIKKESKKWGELYSN